MSQLLLDWSGTTPAANAPAAHVGGQETASDSPQASLPVPAPQAALEGENDAWPTAACAECRLLFPTSVLRRGLCQGCDTPLCACGHEGCAHWEGTGPCVCSCECAGYVAAATDAKLVPSLGGEASVCACGHAADRHVRTERGSLWACRTAGCGCNKWKEAAG